MKKIFTIFFLIVAFISNAQSVSITSNASGAVCAGTNVTFTAITSGISTPSFQWYKNNIAISGATSSTYSTTTLSNNDVIKVSVGDVIVSNSLIQNLDANNPSSYTSGNTWTDLTGNANNANIVTGGTGSIAIATEGNIKSFYFTKGTTYMTAPLSKTASMSFNVWAKNTDLVNTYTNTGTMLFNAGASGTGALNGGPDLLIIANKIYWNTYDATGNPFMLNGTAITTTTAAINDNNWHNFSVTVDAVANSVNLYIDGVFKGTANYKDPRAFSSPTALYIGGEGFNNTYNLGWIGNISAFQSYNKALSLAEVVQNFNSKAAFFGVTSSASYFSNSINVSVSSLSVPTITLVGDACINKTILTTSAGLGTYSWYKDNSLIAGAISNTYTPTVSGSYQVTVSNGICSNTSTATTIYTCAVNAFGKMLPITNTSSIISPEGGANFGTGRDNAGKSYNTTGLTTTTGTIGSTTAVLGGIISPTNAKTAIIGVEYSSNANFSTYSSTTIQLNVPAGSYSTTITGLTSSSAYFARTFITNKAGTSYGGVVAFTTTAPTALDAIVLNLDATNASSYGGNGSIWNDLSGQNNTATFTSAPTYSSNPGSLTFSTASYATTISSTINLTTATFIAWVNPSQIQSNYTGIIYLPKSPTPADLNNRFGMQFRTNNSVGYTWGTNEATTYNWDSQLYAPTNQWSMVAISVSANSTTAYLCNANGITSAINIDTHGAASGFKYYVGRDPISYSSSEADLRTFKGKISRVTVYGSTLTQSDIASIFNAQKATFGIN